MTVSQAAAFPAHTHPFTLSNLARGGSNCDMPVESGPTQLLPFSQTFCEGYLAFNRPEFQDYFTQNYVQIPLQKFIIFKPSCYACGRRECVIRYLPYGKSATGFFSFGRAMEASIAMPCQWHSTLPFFKLT